MNIKDLLIGSALENEVKTDKKIFANLVTIKCERNCADLLQFSSHWVELFKKTNEELYYIVYQDISDNEFSDSDLTPLIESNSAHFFKSSYGLSLSNFHQKEFDELGKYIPLTQNLNGIERKIPIHYVAGKRRAVIIDTFNI